MSNLHPIPLTRLLPFRPDPAWFARDGLGIHGIAHETRVLIWTQVLARLIVLPEWNASFESPVLAWAAAIHDTQRHDDGKDPYHGERAADWLLARPDFLPTGVDPAHVAYLCRWHVPSDAWAPEMTPALQAFKDADALDRWRIGDLNPKYLRLACSRQLIEPAYQLWSRSASAGFEDPDTAFDQVIQAACELGLVSRD